MATPTKNTTGKSGKSAWSKMKNFLLGSSDTLEIAAEQAMPSNNDSLTELDESMETFPCKYCKKIIPLDKAGIHEIGCRLDLVSDSGSSSSKLDEEVKRAIYDYDELQNEEKYYVSYEREDTFNEKNETKVENAQDQKQNIENYNFMDNFILKYNFKNDDLLEQDEIKSFNKNLSKSDLNEIQSHEKEMSNNQDKINRKMENELSTFEKSTSNIKNCHDEKLIHHGEIHDELDYKNFIQDHDRERNDEYPFKNLKVYPGGEITKSTSKNFKDCRYTESILHEKSISNNFKQDRDRKRNEETSYTNFKVYHGRERSDKRISKNFKNYIDKESMPHDESTLKNCKQDHNRERNEEIPSKSFKVYHGRERNDESTYENFKGYHDKDSKHRNERTYRNFEDYPDKELRHHDGSTSRESSGREAGRESSDESKYRKCENHHDRERNEERHNKTLKDYYGKKTREEGTSKNFKNYSDKEMESIYTNFTDYHNRERYEESTFKNLDDFHDSEKNGQSSYFKNYPDRNKAEESLSKNVTDYDRANKEEITFASSKKFEKNYYHNPSTKYTDYEEFSKKFSHYEGENYTDIRNKYRNMVYLDSSDASEDGSSENSYNVMTGEQNVSHNSYSEVPIYRELNESIEKLPCEFCNEMIPFNELVIHESGCRPDLVSFPPLWSKPDEVQKKAIYSHDEIQHEDKYFENKDYFLFSSKGSSPVNTKQFSRQNHLQENETNFTFGSEFNEVKRVEEEILTYKTPQFPILKNSELKYPIHNELSDDDDEECEKLEAMWKKTDIALILRLRELERKKFIIKA